MADILHLLQIHAPRDQVYEAIATAAGVRSWFSRDADFEPKVGGTGEIRFADGKRITKIEIAELEPNRRVVWNVVAAPMPPWAGTRVELEVSAAEDVTMLRFAHRGFAQADDFFATSATAWVSFLISLKHFLETGRGAPHPDDLLSRPPGKP